MQPLFSGPISGAFRRRAPRLAVSYYIALSYSPWAFATANSLPLEIHSDGVGAGVRGPDCLQGPADSEEGEQGLRNNNKAQEKGTRTLRDIL